MLEFQLMELLNPKNPYFMGKWSKMSTLVNDTDRGVPHSIHLTALHQEKWQSIETKFLLQKNCIFGENGTQLVLTVNDTNQGPPQSMHRLIPNQV